MKNLFVYLIASSLPVGEPHWSIGDVMLRLAKKFEEISVIENNPYGLEACMAFILYHSCKIDGVSVSMVHELYDEDIVAQAYCMIDIIHNRIVDDCIRKRSRLLGWKTY